MLSQGFSGGGGGGARLRQQAPVGEGEVEAAARKRQALGYLAGLLALALRRSIPSGSAIAARGPHASHGRMQGSRSDIAGVTANFTMAYHAHTALQHGAGFAADTSTGQEILSRHGACGAIVDCVSNAKECLSSVLAAMNAQGGAIGPRAPAAGRRSALGLVGGRRAGRAQGRYAARRLAAQPAQHALHRQQLQVVQLGHQHAPRAPRLPIPAATIAKCQGGTKSLSAAAVQAAAYKMLSGEFAHLTGACWRSHKSDN